MSAAILTLLCSSTSHATTGLAWNWDGDLERKYLIRSSTTLIYPEVLQGDGTGEALFADLAIAMLVACKATDTLGKKAYEVSCVIDELSLQGVPQRGENADRAKTVTDTLAEAVVGARLVARFSRDGRVSKIDLRDLDRNKSWASVNQVTLQIVLGHALGGLDLQLPKDGDDKGSGSWKQREAKPMSLAIRDFTLGTIKMEHTLTASDGDRHTLSTTSRGTLTPGTESEGESAGITYDTTMEGTAIFDAKTGNLVERQFDVVGSLTSGSRGASGSNRKYIQHLELELQEAE